ncbi:MAG: hypothetical protein N2Z76_04190, partial [Treponemataceae bacterium]|nr:hypothetical protein [Treponemataceae bacterium]
MASFIPEEQKNVKPWDILNNRPSSKSDQVRNSTGTVSLSLPISEHIPYELHYSVVVTLTGTLPNLDIHFRLCYIVSCLLYT